LGHLRDHVDSVWRQSTTILTNLYRGFPKTASSVSTCPGASVLLLALLRLAWRMATPLPPWAPTLTHFERRYEHRVEQVLYVLMLAIPISGVLAAMADGKDVVFFGAIELPPLISEDSHLDDLTVGFHIAAIWRSS